jgi:hypothetical protein
MTPKLKANLIAGAIFAIPVFLLWYCSSNAPKATQQDLTCRSLIRDGQDAKTQTERDYASKKFIDSCSGWKDPYEGK